MTHQSVYYGDQDLTKHFRCDVRTQEEVQCASRERLLSQSQLDQPLKTSTLLEHWSLVWQGTDGLVSTNMATIELGG